MRLYSHYAFREAVRIFLEKNPDAKPEDMKQGFLIDKGDWTSAVPRSEDRERPTDATPLLRGRVTRQGIGS